MLEDDAQIRRTKSGGLMLPGDVVDDAPVRLPMDLVDVVDVVDVLPGLRPPAGIGGCTPSPEAATGTGTLTRDAGTLTRGGKRRVTFSSEPPDVSVVPGVPDVALEMDELCVKL